MGARGATTGSAAVLRVAFLASHGGSGFAAVVGAVRSGRLAAVAPVLLLSNNSAAEAMQRARAAGVAAVHLSAATHPDPDALDRAICRALEEQGADLVVLSGYMRKLGPQTLRRFDGRVLNCHPALLPRFGGAGMYGRRVHEAVLAAGDRVTGATVHQVDGEYDHGPVLARREVPVRPGDTPASLEARVKEAEASLLVDTLRAVACGALRLPTPGPPPAGARPLGVREVPDPQEARRPRSDGPGVAAAAGGGTVFLVRHCSAGSADRWRGDDRLRPLDPRGRRQAAALVTTVRAEGAAVGRVVSSPYLRCCQSVEPLADALGVPLDTADALAQGGDLESALRLLRALPAGGSVLCTHGDILPALLERLAAEDGLGLGGGSPPCEKGSAWILGMPAPGRFRAARYVPPRA